MGQLQGKTALIIGGGNGIGQATSFLFAGEGANVVVADFNLDAAKKTIADCGFQEESGLALQCDVSEEDDVANVVAGTLEKYKRIDILFNCAGGGSAKDGPVTDLDLEEFWRTIRVDLFGTLLGCRKVIPEMVKTGGGSIINISSLRAVMGTRGADAYTASKGGVLALTRAMAMQWADKNIRVNVLAPGVVLTERIRDLIREDDPIYRKMLLGPCEPEDVANIALYLASDASKKVTGEVFRIDGGASIY